MEVLTVRLFFGVGLPDPLRTEIARIQSLLRPAGADVRWVRPANAHLTLKFLGEVPADELEALDSAVRGGTAPGTAADDTLGATGAPATGAHWPESDGVALRVQGIGTFPARGPIEVIWVGIGGDVEALARVHASLETALAGVGFAPERRRFHPHVTLGRVRHRRSSRPRARDGGDTARALREAITAHAGVDLGAWRPRAFELYESRLSPAGAAYRVAARYPLAP